MCSSCHICSTPQSRFYEFISPVSLISIEKSGDYLVLAEITVCIAWHIWGFLAIQPSQPNQNVRWFHYMSFSWLMTLCKILLNHNVLSWLYLPHWLFEIVTGLGNLPVSLLGSKALLFASMSIFCLDWDTDTLLICFLLLGYIQFYRYSLEWDLITSAWQGVPGRCLLNSGFANSSGSLGIFTSE